jgi:ribosome-binding factor A
MPALRQERVRELLKRAIGEAVRREFSVDEVGLISVNDVDVGGDLQSALVFISILGNPSQQKRGLQVLEEHRIRLQGLVAKSVVLKYTPKLKFVVDDSIVRGNRVLQIIDELEKESGGPKNETASVSKTSGEA